MNKSTNLRKPIVKVMLFTMLTSLMLSGGNSWADNSASKEEKTSSTTTLKGTVVEVVTTLDNLQDARLSISRVRKAAANLYDEVNRQQVSMNYNPNFVGSAVITIASPTIAHALPARKKWIDASVSEIGPIIELFKEDVSTAVENNRRTNASAAARKQLDPIREEAFRLVRRSFNDYSQIKGLTSGAHYDNAAISAATKRLDDNMKNLDRSLKKGIAILQKDSKTSKKAKA